MQNLSRQDIAHMSTLIWFHEMFPDYGVFTLPDTETDKETDQKMTCLELWGGVHAAETGTNTDSH